MKIIQILILLLGIGGGITGSSFVQKIKLNKLEKSHQKEINLKIDTIKTLRQNVKYLVSQDSLKSELIVQGQSTMLVIQKQNWQLKRDSIKTNQALKEVLAWKLDAEDGVIIIKDTVKVKRKLFGGYKIVN